MKQCIALAGLLCLVASGCAQNGLLARNKCGEACHVARSRNAPRPLITRNGAKPSANVFGGVEQCGYDGCACGDACASGTCGLGSCGCGNGGGAFGSGCCTGGGCRKLVDGIAGGFCGPNGCAMCPTAQQYPEYPRFTPGPPVGQVAYPYYTVRGPRDFLQDNPPTIGPY
jgi:hypothetical protein